MILEQLLSFEIRKLGTAAPYGCNDHIDNIRNPTSSGCQSVNVFNLFDRLSMRPQGHGSRKYNKPEKHDVSFDGILPFVPRWDPGVQDENRSSVSPRVV